MIDDDYDDYEDDAPRRAGWIAAVYRWLLGIGGVAVLVFGGVYLHYSFGGGGTAAPQQGGVPLIRAAQGPVKVRPADPGGRKVPNVGLEVYDAAQLKKLPGKPSEDLLAPGKPRPAAKRDPVPKGPACQVVPNLLAETGRYRLAALKLAASKLAASKQAASGNKAEARSIRTVPRVAPAAGNAGRSKARADRTKAGTRKPAGKDRRTAKAGSFRIQLGAFRTRAKATKHGRGLQRQHSTLLDRLDMVVERVDLGSKGIFFRLRAGPFANRQTARSLCRTLGKRRINCFLVSG